MGLRGPARDVAAPPPNESLQLARPRVVGRLCRHHPDTLERTMRAAVVLVSWLALMTHPLSAQTTVRSNGPASPVKSQMARLAGTWRLITTRQRMTDGTIRPDPDLGSRPSGYLMFDAAAEQMCTVINNGDRANWKNAAQPTDAEAQAIWTQTVSYCAAWSIDSTGSQLVYRLGANMSPNLIGAERRRRFTLDGERLILIRPHCPPAFLYGRSSDERHRQHRANRSATPARVADHATSLARVPRARPAARERRPRTDRVLPSRTRNESTHHCAPSRLRRLTS